MLAKIIFLTISLTNLFSTVISIEINLNESSIITLSEGQSIQLNCPFDIEKNQTVNMFKWYKNDEKILSILTDSRIQVFMKKLKINKFKKIDSAIYKCEIVKGNGEIFQSKSVLLKSHNNNSNKIRDQSSLMNVKVKGEIPIFTYDYKIETKFYYESMAMELDCSVYASTDHMILWYKDGRVIGEEEYGLVRNKMNFKIKHLVSSDSGEYRCQVTNQYGEINRYFQVQVVKKEKLDIKSNKPAILECKKGDVEWYVYYKNKEIKQTIEQPKISIGQDTFFRLMSINNYLSNDNQLFIINPSIMDNGIYACLNKSGFLSSKVYDLDVIEFRNQLNIVEKNSLFNSNIPLSIIFIIILTIFSLVLIVVLLCYYLIKFKGVKQSNLECNDNLSSKLNQKREISNSMHHLSRTTIENSKLKRHSFVPMVTNSTPTIINMYQQNQMAQAAITRTFVPVHSFSSNNGRTIQLNYYPIYRQSNNNSQSLLSASLKNSSNI